MFLPATVWMVAESIFVSTLVFPPSITLATTITRVRSQNTIVLPVHRAPHHIVTLLAGNVITTSSVLLTAVTQAVVAVLVFMIIQDGYPSQAFLIGSHVSLPSKIHCSPGSIFDR